MLKFTDPEQLALIEQFMHCQWQLWGVGLALVDRHGALLVAVPSDGDSSGVRAVVAEHFSHLPQTFDLHEYHSAAEVSSFALALRDDEQWLATLFFGPYRQLPERSATAAVADGEGDVTRDDEPSAPASSPVVGAARAALAQCALRSMVALWSQAQATALDECRKGLAHCEAFERLLAGISQRFMALPPSQTDQAIYAALQDLGVFAEVERSYVFSVSADLKQMSNSHEWCAHGVAAQQDRLQNVELAGLPWFAAQIQSQAVVYVPSVAALPAEAACERQHWQQQSIKSVVVVPIHTRGTLSGFIGFDSVEGEKRWGTRDFSALESVAGMVGAALERQHVTEQLVVQSERQALALQTSNEGVWDWNPLTDEIYYNPRFFAMLGYDPDRCDCTFESLAGLLHPDDRGSTLRSLREFSSGWQRQGLRLEFRMCAKDGSMVDILLRGQVVERNDQGLPCRIIGTHLDISALKTAQRRLHAALEDAQVARQKVDAILKSVVDGLVVADLDQRVVLLNRAAELLCGEALAVAQGQPVATLFAVPQLQKQLQQVVAGGEAVACIEWQQADSEEEWLRTIQASSSLVYSSCGEKSGTITLLRDISQQRRLDQMKNEFISTAAHELRTPLTAIKGFTEVLLAAQQFGVTERAQQLEILTIIYQKAQRLETIISDLLDLGRVQSGQLVRLQRAEVEMNALLRRIVAEAQSADGGHRWTLTLPPQPVIAHIDAKKIEQVMENLLNNAQKFSPPASEIQVVAEVTRCGYFKVQVCDHGLGMSPGQTAQVFDKFYRANGSNTALPGLGLGMTIVKAIVEAHGGSIEVNSQLGVGTQVTFQLPLDGGASPAPPTDH